MMMLRTEKAYKGDYFFFYLSQEKVDRQFSDGALTFLALWPKCFIIHVSYQCLRTGQQLLSEKLTSKVKYRMVYLDPQFLKSRGNKNSV